MHILVEFIILKTLSDGIHLFDLVDTQWQQWRVTFFILLLQHDTIYCFFFQTQRAPFCFLRSWHVQCTKSYSCLYAYRAGNLDDSTHPKLYILVIGIASAHGDSCSVQPIRRTTLYRQTDIHFELFNQKLYLKLSSNFYNLSSQKSFQMSVGEEFLSLSNGQY